MPTKEEIEDRMFEGLNDEYDQSEGSIMFDAVTGVAQGLEDAYIELDIVKSKAFVENLVGDELTMKCAESGVYRKEALAATTTLLIEGTNGTIIPTDFRPFVGDIYYHPLESQTITNGSVSVLFESEQVGTVGNVPANSIVNFEPIEGITSVTNPNPVTNGIDEESDEDLRQRFYEKVRTPATSGNKQHYINWCKEVPGVGDAKVFPLWNGNGTVKCIVINSNKRSADQAIVDSVLQNIEEQRPIGAIVTVESALELPININVDIDLEVGYELTAVSESISNAITDHLKKIAFQRTDVSFALIGSIILEVEGVSDYRNLTLNDGTSNVTIGDTQVAVVGVLDVA